MKILYHHRTLGDGAEGIHIAAMAEAFRNLGHEVKMAAMIGARTNESTSRTRTLEYLTRWAPRLAYEAMELGYNLVGYRMLASHLNGWRPDVLYERYTLFNLAGLVAARRMGVPFILEVNAPLAYERATYEKLSWRWMARRCERFVCSQADLVIVVSTPLKNHLLEEGVPAERVAVFPNGVDPMVFRPDTHARNEVRQRLGIPEEIVVVGCAGILRPWHGIELLLQAVASMEANRDKVRVLIVGDGPSRSSLEQLTKARRLQNCTIFTGRVRHEEIPRYLNAMDVGVSLRATFYASPMKVPEYMATGLTVLAPRMLNLCDLINDGVDGLLFPPEDVQALATTLSSLISDPKRRCQLGEHARASILANRTWRHNAVRVLDFLRKGRI